MGKGDKRTRRGKTYRGTHGNTRPHSAKTTGGGKSVTKTGSKARPRKKTA